MAALEKSASYVSRTPSASCRSASGKTDQPSSNNLTETSKSTTDIPGDAPSLKPLNIFYIWYYELCRRQNTHPLPAITHGSSWHNNQILDFSADRVKLEDWQPIINALMLDMSLHVIRVHSKLTGQKVLDHADTEERVKKIKKWFGTICTKYILKNLLKSVSNCLKISQVLTCLELDGLQISGQYLQIVMKALLSNKSLKYLSFKGCPIEEEGCQEICEALHQMPNIEVLNLSSCSLTAKCGEFLAKVIKYQQINRYCQSWHSSLRYEDPMVNNMAGIKRLTLNNNPALGDIGVDFILQELIDDLWVRALDMQRCGVTEEIAPRILDLLHYTKSLRIVDFRKNHLQPETVTKILEMLKEKQQTFEDESEYHWCYTSTTLDSAAYGTYISLTNSKLHAKGSRTTRIRHSFKTNSTTSHTKNTNQKFTKEKINTTLQKPEKNSLERAKEQLMHLYARLKDETKKRENAEKKCKELQKQVEELLVLQKNQMILKEFTNMKQYISKFISYVKEHGELQGNDSIVMNLQNALEEVHVLAKPFETPRNCITPKETVVYNSPAEGSIAEVIDTEPDYTAADLKLQSMFQNLLGPSSTSLDSTLNLDLSLSDRTQSVDSVAIAEDLVCDSPRQDSICSSDSDSVETLKRLLEELGQDDEEQSWYTEDAETVSGTISGGRSKRD